jgi:hypothetical protein
VKALWRGEDIGWRSAGGFTGNRPRSLHHIIDCAEHLASVAKHHADLLQVWFRQVGQNTQIDSVFDK